MNQNLNQISQQNQKTYDYKTIKLLGKGSYGQAYLIQCLNDNKYYVVKRINLEPLSESERQESWKEAKILEKMNHSNIIKFKEVLIAKKPEFTLNIITEYADGGDLGEKIKAQPKYKYFPESQILDWFTQLCWAIKHIHDKHIIHRDWKAQNIFLTKSGLVKWGDFGIAKNWQCTWQKAKTMVGTPYYLSPEIVQNKPYSYKSDIWSLGVLLYEWIALKMPFDAKSLPMLSLKIAKGNYPPVPSLFTKDLRVWVGQLLNVDPNKRPSVNEILRMPIIKGRIQSFWSEVEYNNAFSKTAVKKYIEKKKTDHVNNFMIKLIEKKPEKVRNVVGNENIYVNNHGNGNNVMISKDSQKRHNSELNFKMKNNLKVDKENGKEKEKGKEQEKEREKMKVEVEDKDKEKEKEKDKEKEKGKENEPNRYKEMKIHNSPTAQRKSLDWANLVQNRDDTTNIKDQEKKKFISEKNWISEFLKKEKNESNWKVSQSSDKTNPTNNNSNESGNTNSNKAPWKQQPTKENPKQRIIPLRNFIKKRREETKKQTNTEDIIWFDESTKKPKQQKQIKPRSNFPEIIFVGNPNPPLKIENETISETSNDVESNEIVNEDQFDQNRLWNNLNQIVNNGMEDSDNDDKINLERKSSDNSGINDEINFDVVNSVNNSKESEMARNSCSTIPDNWVSDYGEIEELRIVLEKELGIDWFKTVYHHVEENTDPNLFTYDYDSLKESLTKEMLNKMKNKEYTKEEVVTAINKIPEVFSVVSKERSLC